MPRSGRVLAVDPGSVRTGLALTDPSQTIASPAEILTRLQGEALVQALVERVRRHQAVGVVVGVPVSMDGQEGPQALASRRLIAALAARVRVPVEGFDERLTSRDAEAAFIEAGIRASDRRGKVDAVAAAVLLRAWLEARG